MLPYTSEVYAAFLKQYAEAIWPVPGLLWLLASIALFVTIRPFRGSAVLVGLVLAVAWLWVGAVFHIGHLAALNFAAPVYGAVFVAQGLLLGSVLAVRRRHVFALPRDAAGWGGPGLAVYALVGQPLLDLLSGRDWPGLALVGTAPAPTALFTLALLTTVEGRPPLYLAVVPLLWLLVTGWTAWALSMPADYAVALAGVLAFGLLAVEHRRRRLTRR